MGETEAERDSGATLDVVLGQLRQSLPVGSDAGNTVVAYEPVWAIGTGRTPTLDQIAEVHDALRADVPDAEMSLLYGGSVKPGNASDILHWPMSMAPCWRGVLKAAISARSSQRLDARP